MYGYNKVAKEIKKNSTTLFWVATIKKIKLEECT